MLAIKAKTIKTTVVAIIMMVPLFNILSTVQADVLTGRNVTIFDSKPAVTTSHRFNFRLPSITTLGSIEFEYCENDPFVGSPCTPPAGLDLSAANLSSQTGETGFTIHPSSTSNKLIISRTPAVPSAIPVSYRFVNITNPSDANKTVYVRMATYSSDDATGSRIDEGSVVFSTSKPVTVQGFVPPYLTFCVGVTITYNCSSSSGSLINFGALSTSQTRYLTSEFSGATNDPGGFTTSVNGVTMTSGNNIIPALSSPQPSQTSVSQFGMNLRANSAPGVGAEPFGPGSSSPVAQVNIPNLFFFKNQVITSSTIPTDFKKFTASYIVNVSPAQKPGIYSTTLTYIAVAAF